MIKPGKLNLFLLAKLPSAWLCGVRVKKIDSYSCEVSVKHRWINQNPFNSMYFAVQAMAAELSTGALVQGHILSRKANISMLVAQNKSVFNKKAKGIITFTCNDGQSIAEAIERTVTNGEGQTVWMESRGINEDGVEVSRFNFEWTVKRK